jgi:hypothetical protein
MRMMMIILDRKTKKLLTIHGQHHPKENTDHLYVPRKQEGRGLIQLEEAYILEIMKLMEYVDRKEYPLTPTQMSYKKDTKFYVQRHNECGT